MTVPIFAVPTTCQATHRVIIPHAYVREGWDSVLIISNLSDEPILPVVFVLNGLFASDCFYGGTLQPGKIFVSSFSTIPASAWVYGRAPIPGIFEVWVSANQLGETDPPFGAAVAINNASFGGFSMQQFISEYIGEEEYFCERHL